MDFTLIIIISKNIKIIIFRLVMMKPKIYDKIDFTKTYIFDRYEIVYCNHKDYTKWYKIDLKKKVTIII